LQISQKKKLVLVWRWSFPNKIDFIPDSNLYQNLDYQVVIPRSNLYLGMFYHDGIFYELRNISNNVQCCNFFRREWGLFCFNYSGRNLWKKCNNVSTFDHLWDFVQKSQFCSKIAILVKNRNFGQKSEVCSKIAILVKNRKFAQKLKFWSKIAILVKNRHFWSKNRNFCRNSRFRKFNFTFPHAGQTEPVGNEYRFREKQE